MNRALHNMPFQKHDCKNKTGKAKIKRRKHTKPQKTYIPQSMWFKKKYSATFRRTTKSKKIKVVQFKLQMKHTFQEARVINEWNKLLMKMVSFLQRLDTTLKAMLQPNTIYWVWESNSWKRLSWPLQYRSHHLISLGPFDLKIYESSDSQAL